MKNRHKGKKIVAMIPTKLGSTRLAMKNLALVNGKPAVYYAIKAAEESGVFARVVINAEDTIFSKIAERYHIDFYKRSDRLVRPDTKTDEVVYDFLKNNSCDIVAWVSPIAPLQTGEDVKGAVEYFIRNNLDSLMTVKNEQVHCIYKDKPINFRVNEIFTQTQDILPIRSFVYSIMIWRARPFMHAFEQKGYALLCGKVGYFAVSKLSSIIIKTQEDLMLADDTMRILSSSKKYKVSYDRIVRGIINM